MPSTVISVCFGTVIVTPFDDALGRPSDHGRRVARNTQLILQEESNLGRVIDPAAGSYYLERLTDELTRVAWGRFQHIEALGGIAAAVLDGSLAGQVAQTSAERAARIATRRDPITGVSEFPNLGESLPEPMPRSRRSSGAPPAAATVVTPLPVVGLADDFEALRSASDRFLAASGARPRVFLANLGPVAVHTARATFARNFLEAGGIEAYTYSNGQTREWLLETDSRLYELVRQVIPAHKMPGNVYVGRARQSR